MFGALKEAKAILEDREVALYDTVEVQPFWTVIKDSTPGSFVIPESGVVGQVVGIDRERLYYTVQTNQPVIVGDEHSGRFRVTQDGLRGLRPSTLALETNAYSAEQWVYGAMNDRGRAEVKCKSGEGVITRKEIKQGRLPSFQGGGTSSHRTR